MLYTKDYPVFSLLRVPVEMMACLVLLVHLYVSHFYTLHPIHPIEFSITNEAMRHEP